MGSDIKAVNECNRLRVRQINELKGGGGGGGRGKGERKKRTFFNNSGKHRKNRRRSASKKFAWGRDFQWVKPTPFSVRGGQSADVSEQTGTLRLYATSSDLRRMLRKGHLARERRSERCKKESVATPSAVGPRGERESARLRRTSADNCG